MHEDDRHDSDPIDHFSEPIDAHNPSETPAPHTPGAAPTPAVYCRGCGGQLAGVSIGEPCPNCGAIVGSGTNTAKTSGLAITSMVLGIISIPVCMCYGIFSIIIGIVGLVMASMAHKEIARGGYTDSSKSMATAGKICSWVGLGLGVAYILFIVFVIIIAESSP